MNRKQYKILCALRSTRSLAKKRYARLWIINQDPRRQYDWDAMKVAEGWLAALELSVANLEAFIRATPIDPKRKK